MDKMNGSGSDAKSPARKKSPAERQADSRSRRTQILYDLLDQQDSALDLARRMGTRMSRIHEIREALEQHKADLDWFRQHEPEILDSLRSQILTLLLADTTRKYSPLDYAVLLDKARLLRGESSINLHGIFQIIRDADALETARAKELAEPAPDAVPGTAPVGGGTGGQPSGP